MRPPCPQPVLVPVAIALEDADIAAAESSPPGVFEPDEVIDGSVLAAVPGLFNTHNHAVTTLERGAENLSSDRWLNEKIRGVESVLEEEDVTWDATRRQYLAAQAEGEE